MREWAQYEVGPGYTVWERYDAQGVRRVSLRFDAEASPSDHRGVVCRYGVPKLMRQVIRDVRRSEESRNNWRPGRARRTDDDRQTAGVETLALALVLRFADAASRAREPLTPCTDAGKSAGPRTLTDYLPGAPAPRPLDTCYREWRAESQSGDDHPTPDVVDEWCEACRASDAAVRRRREAARERGAALRGMHALARKVRRGGGA